MNEQQLPKKPLSIFDNCPRGFEDELVRLMDDYARAAVSEANSLAAKVPDVPAGYKLVPVEPTPEMVKAAIDSLRDAHCIVPQPWKMQDALEAALAAGGEASK